METTFCCHSCGTEVTAFALRCPTCYVGLREASRAPAPLRASASQRAGGPVNPPTENPALYSTTRCRSCGAAADDRTGWCSQCVVPMALVMSAPAGGHDELPLPPLVAWPGDTSPAGSPPGLRYATWGQRATASLIDISVPAIGLIVAYAVTALLGPAVGLILGAATVCFYIWQVFVVQAKSGQSLGKAQVGIALCRQSDLGPVGVGTSIVRQLAHGLDILLVGIGYLLPLWDHRRQTLADKLCGTVVIVA